MTERKRAVIGSAVHRLICVLSLLIVSAGCATPKITRDAETRGLEYSLREIKDPRPNRVHILRVDLSKGTLEPVVVLG